MSAQSAYRPQTSGCYAPSLAFVALRNRQRKRVNTRSSNSLSTSHNAPASAPSKPSPDSVMAVICRKYSDGAEGGKLTGAWPLRVGGGSDVIVIGADDGLSAVRAPLGDSSSDIVRVPPAVDV